MSSCPKTSPYTINIHEKKDTKFPYNIKTNLPAGAKDERVSMNQKCDDLGWPKPLDNADIKKFIDTDMNSEQCFTNPTQTIRGFYFENNHHKLL